MSRDWRLFWADILLFCDRVERYSAGMTRVQFFSNQLVFDAVMRNVELIGEASRNLPPEALALAPSIDWKAIKAMRNVIAHVYFGLDDDILWHTVRNDVPELRRTLETITLP